MAIFSRFSTNNMRLSKLHSWRYHVIPAIRRFETINGFTTDTYETLHKFYVKNPYRKSNKKDIMNQILNKVRNVDCFLKNLVKLTKTYVLNLDSEKILVRDYGTNKNTKMWNTVG